MMVCEIGSLNTVSALFALYPSPRDHIIRFDDVIRLCLHFDAIIRLMTAIGFTFYPDYQGNEKLKRTCVIAAACLLNSLSVPIPGRRQTILLVLLLGKYFVCLVALARRSVAEDSRVTK